MAGRVNVVLDRAVYYDNDTIVGMLFTGMLLWQLRTFTHGKRFNSCFQSLNFYVGEFILLPFEDTEIVNIAVELQCICAFSHHKAGGEAKVVTIMYEKSISMWLACISLSRCTHTCRVKKTNTMPYFKPISPSKQVLCQRE